MSISDQIRSNIDRDKRVTINAGTESEPIETEWVIRHLSQGVLDRIRAKARRRGTRGDDYDDKVLRRETLREGIVSGPEDWMDGAAFDAQNQAHVDILLEAWAFGLHLHQAIGDFHALDEETRLGFR